ncbi:dipeptide/oligopeptide/nickel ABC transporter permease/ATP-binding protein [Candidatus Poriferisodalis sp.]|uniref:dipeptide/oligopeptide/nickel ABC transporter permease/ATP-binding protein n=1 Tax=Candidatus Poriferisodalis sp. TaxID=3101277 RepID=UPI003B011526
MSSPLRRLVTRPGGYVPLLWLLLVAFCAVFPTLAATHEPNTAEFTAVLDGPSADHWLGTDDLGRDNYSRLVHSSRTAVVAMLQAVGTALILGVPIGLFVGYAGGWWDRIVMRIVDAIFSLPGLILAFAIIAILGPGLTNAMIAVGVLFALRFIRLTRAMVLSVREEPFIEAAQLSGAPTRTILGRYLLPNMYGPLIVQTTISLAAVLLIEAALSFLGLGVQQPDATWGSMLRAARSLQRDNPITPWPPGLAITFTVLAFNALGDALRDVLAEGSGGRIKAARRGVAVGLADDGAPARREEAPAEPTRPDAVLAVRNLYVTVPTDTGRAPAVRDLSFDVAPGEIVGLVGESGSGKTVTALAIAGLLPRGLAVDPGSSINFEGQQLVGKTESQMAGVRGTGIGMIFQDPTASLNPALTVGFQLAEPLRIHGDLSRKAAVERAADLLDRVGVASPRQRLRDYPHQFSGGMAQRVMTAMALASEPSLIIADEPTTALDVTTQQQVLELLVGLCEDFSMAMLFITHDLGVVAEVCDRAVVMYAGEAVETGRVYDLFAQPGHPYSQALLASVPLLDGGEDQLVTITGRVPAPNEEYPGCRFADRCEHMTSYCTERPVSLVPLEGDGRSSRCVLADDLQRQGAAK